MGSTRSTSAIGYSLAVLAATVALGSLQQSSDASLLYGVDNYGGIYQLDTTGNGGVGQFTKLTLSGNYVDASGNTVSALSARGITADAAGNLYIGSNSMGGLYKITVSGATGVISRVGGTWTGISDMTTDGTYLYVGAGAVVNRVNIATGVSTDTIGGANWNGSVGGVSLAADGTLYFSGKLTGATNSNVYYINKAATAASKSPPLSSTYGPATPTNVGLRDVVVVGDLVLAAESDGKIVDSALNTYLTTGTLSPSSISYDQATGHLFVYGTDSGTAKIFEYDENKQLVSSYATPGNASWFGTTTVAAVPEVASLSLIAAGAGTLLMRRRKV